MDKFNLPKSLLDAVSNVVGGTKKQQAEQNVQFRQAMEQKFKPETIRPLTAAKLAEEPKREAKDKALHDSIRGIVATSVVAAQQEQQTAVGRINAMYSRMGAVRPVAEAKAHTMPKTDKEKSLAALATPKNKITHKDVMVGRGVIAKEEIESIGEEVHVMDNEGGTHVRVTGANTTAELDHAIENHLVKHHKMTKKQATRHYANWADGADWHHYSPKDVGAHDSKPDETRTKEEHAKNIADRVVDFKNQHESLNKVGEVVNEADVKEGWEDMLKAVNSNKGTGKFDKKEIKPGVTQYTRKSSTFDDGGKDADMKKADKKMKNEDVEQVAEVSNQTKRDYIDAAAVDTARLGNTLGRLQANKANSSTQKMVGDKLTKRIKGISRAAQTMKNEETDTPGNSYQHQCALHVKHAKLGEGKTLFSQHAEPDETGSISWYDIMFEHGIEKQVPTADLEIVVSESHMNHKKKK